MLPAVVLLDDLEVEVEVFGRVFGVGEHDRAVVLDDRVVLFANPEDAAEYISFDLKAV